VKRFKFHWLAIVVLLGLHVQADAQQGAQAKPNGPQQIKGAPTDQQAEQLYRTMIVDQPQTVFPDINFTWNAAGNGPGWFGLLDKTVGMSLAPADDALRTHLSLPKDQGLIVTAMEVHAPAAQAGIQQNDVLLTLDEASLAKTEDLEAGLKGAGDKPVALTILRGGKKLKIQVQPHFRVTMGPVQPEPPAFWIGISVSPLEPALRSQLKIPANQGLLAIDVVKDGPAAKAEVKLHDILLSLAGKPLESQEKLVELVQASGEKTVPLELIRAGKTLTIDVMPQRRKAGQIQVTLNPSEMLYYQLVRPGALVTVDQTGAVATVDKKGSWIADATSINAGAPASRLDEIATDIKQLRKSIEELNKTLKDKK
jgi:membrane-associated protease RseP (regulator of RpoE activity)